MCKLEACRERSQHQLNCPIRGEETRSSCRLSFCTSSIGPLGGMRQRLPSGKLGYPYTYAHYVLPGTCRQPLHNGNGCHDPSIQFGIGTTSTCFSREVSNLLFLTMTRGQLRLSRNVMIVANAFSALEMFRIRTEHEVRCCIRSSISVFPQPQFS
jgi:hypothetical protein